MKIFIKKALFPTIIFILLFILVIYLATSTPTKNTIYVLKSYKNSVALYNNDKIIKIYDSVVLNTLPETDIQSFNNGITVSTPTQADIYIEDFE